MRVVADSSFYVLAVLVVVHFILLPRMFSCVVEGMYGGYTVGFTELFNAKASSNTVGAKRQRHTRKT